MPYTPIFDLQRYRKCIDLLHYSTLNNIRINNNYWSKRFRAIGTFRRDPDWYQRIFITQGSKVLIHGRNIYFGYDWEK